MRIKPEVHPTIHTPRARRVPFAIRDRLEAELDREEAPC